MEKSISQYALNIKIIDSILSPNLQKTAKDGLRRQEIYWGIVGSSEYFIRDDDKLFWYDFTIPSHKIIIEYNGEHVHPNPALSLQERDDWKHAFSGELFNERMVHEQRKQQAAERLGYTIIYVWSKNEIPTTIIMEQIDDIINK
jgi:hypothetical protein